MHILWGVYCNCVKVSSVPVHLFSRSRTYEKLGQSDKPVDSYSVPLQITVCREYKYTKIVLNQTDY